MPILNRTILKSFYETGDKPTQAQFAALIDSNLNLGDDHYLLGLREYDITLAYLVGDSVIYNGAIYVCTANTSGTFNPANWNKIAGSVPGAVVYKGAWDANLNVPDLQTISVLMGEYYVVSVAGNTNLDGITDWNIGDWAIYNGTEWEKIDNSDMVSDGENVAGTGVGVFKIKAGTLLQFKKIQNNDGSLYVTEDGSNSFIDFGINFDDAGTSPIRAWSAQKINSVFTTKVDKVVGAVANNFASLDGTGNLLDSGLTASSFLAASAVAANIPVTPVGNITATNVQTALQELDTIKEPANANIQAHIANMSNPHSTTKAQVGLGNVTDDQQLSVKNYAIFEPQQSTALSAPSFAVALTLNFTPAVAGNYFVEWYFELAKNSAAVMTVGARVLLDGSPISAVSPRYPTSDNFTSFSGFNLQNLTAAPHTVLIQYAHEAGAAGDALIRRARFRVVKA